MRTVAVQSTTLVAMAYDLGQQILQLEFRNRAVYRYFGVPSDLYQALLTAPSKGSYFNRFIRGRFAYVRG